MIVNNNIIFVLVGVRRLKNEYEEVNRDTGEIVVRQSQFSVKVKTIPFTMIFEEIIEVSNGLTGTELRLFFLLCKESVYNTGILPLTPATRRRIRTALGMSDQFFYKCMLSLKNKALVILNEDQEYVLNPLYGWRGELKERQKALNEDSKRGY